MEPNLTIDPTEARSLARTLAQQAATPIYAALLPGEHLPGVGPFLTALNSAIESLAHRARAQCLYVDHAVTTTMQYLHRAEDTDQRFGHALDSL